MRGAQEVRPGLCPGPAGDKSPDPITWQGEKAGGDSLVAKASLPPAFSPCLNKGSKDLSLAGSRGRAPGLASFGAHSCS
jgi:hypothetical protein